MADKNKNLGGDIPALLEDGKLYQFELPLSAAALLIHEYLDRLINIESFWLVSYDHSEWRSHVFVSNMLYLIETWLNKNGLEGEKIIYYIRDRDFSEVVKRNIEICEKQKVAGYDHKTAFNDSVKACANRKAYEQAAFKYISEESLRNDSPVYAITESMIVDVAQELDPGALPPGEPPDIQFEQVRTTLLDNNKCYELIRKAIRTALWNVISNTEAPKPTSNKSPNGHK